MFLNNQQVTEEIKMEMENFLGKNDNENRTTENLWDAGKAVVMFSLSFFPRKFFISIFISSDRKSTRLNSSHS